jgi:hypothetical protein
VPYLYCSALSKKKKKEKKKKPKSLAIKESVNSDSRSTDEGWNRRIMNDGGKQKKTSPQINGVTTIILLHCTV